MGELTLMDDKAVLKLSMKDDAEVVELPFGK